MQPIPGCRVVLGLKNWRECHAGVISHFVGECGEGISTSFIQYVLGWGYFLSFVSTHCSAVICGVGRPVGVWDLWDHSSRIPGGGVEHVCLFLFVHPQIGFCLL